MARPSLECLASRSGNGIGSSSIFSRLRFDPAPVFQAQQCAIQRPRFEHGATKGANVLDHRIPVFGPIRKTQQNEQSHIRKTAQIGGIAGHSSASILSYIQFNIVSTTELYWEAGANVKSLTG